MTRPFDAAPEYRARGWLGTLPLPVGKKLSPPSGYTGATGAWPTEEKVFGWLRNGTSNIALRLPETVVGIDVDAYVPKHGGETLDSLTERWGALPPTWVSTSRDDGISGIRLFRIVADVEAGLNDPGTDIETIRFGHRYIVAAPSLHPEGRRYRWVRPDGTPANEGEYPSPDDLPELPAAWLGGLVQRATPAGSTNGHADESPERLTRHDEIVRFAGKLRFAGGDTTDIEAALVARLDDGRIYSSDAAWPWTPEDLQKIAADIGHKPQNGLPPPITIVTGSRREGHHHDDGEDLAKPTVFDEDKRFVPAWAGAALRAEGHILHGSDDRLWRWSDGVYVPDAEQWTAERLRQIIGKPYRDNHRRETVGWLETFMPVEIGLGDPNVINVANGRLDWRTGNLREHSPDLVTAVKLPVAWDPGGTCPTVDTFLDDVLDETLHGLVEEIAGLLLIPDQRFRKAVLLIGGGLNGKSTLLHLLVALLGRGATSSVSLRELDDDKFKAAELFGRLANICGDIDYRQSRASGMFKKIVGGDAITAERKFGQPFSFYPKARLIFSANQVPASSDTSPAWFDRWLIVPMTKRIDPGQVDPGMADRLTTPGELSGFLVRAVGGLRRLVARGHFDVPELAREALDEYRASIEPVAGFLEEHCILGDESRVSRSVLYETFSKWCDQQGHRPLLSARAFAGRLRDQVPGLDETKLGGTRYWIGVGLLTTEFSYAQN